MRKSILILVSLIVLFSLFNTIETSFKLWNSPTINTNHIITPDISVSFDTDISLFGLFINFFSDLELDYVINNTANKFFICFLFLINFLVNAMHPFFKYWRKDKR